MLKKQMTSMLISFVKPDLIKELIVELLWILAKQTDNQIDDEIVKSVAERLDIELD